MDEEQLQRVLHEALPGAHIEIVTPDRVHYDVHVVSDAFQGLSRVARERRVTRPLRNVFQDGTLHALSVRTHTPEEWKQQPWKANSSTADTRS